MSRPDVTTAKHKDRYLTWCVRGQPQIRVFRIIRLQSIFAIVRLFDVDL